MDVAVFATRIATCLHARCYGFIQRCLSRHVVGTPSHYNRNTLVVVYGFNLTICSALLSTTTQCYFRGFLFA